MKETGSKIELKGMEPILGLMEDSTQALGKTTICMAMASIHGKTVVDMKDIMKWIRNMGMVCINGQTAEDMKEIG